jgi:hypothetical protein
MLRTKANEYRPHIAAILCILYCSSDGWWSRVLKAGVATDGKVKYRQRDITHPNFTHTSFAANAYEDE